MKSKNAKCCDIVENDGYLCSAIQTSSACRLVIVALANRLAIAGAQNSGAEKAGHHDIEYVKCDMRLDIESECVPLQRYIHR
jgi:hypothetical protein